ncbi:D-isomer specific 2-hydroxyacid dehydrogenase [Fimicolochytrium jonesii]|uniref:D-isomer specific 2-hydroxyacid dehydrogenase n=1 Tax=Fimicolochytrium jonesii TaxID=1396493 RepID=UPI0022FEFC65|nr:D-isomer specific 2-hydroxyacid dehydrogenase [Fimicolochytrium jonesii]KAI8822868.1 D-isomer specific 2-hydroxyacid dehydrogenase [Fimicolochytrium jonesii]
MTVTKTPSPTPTSSLRLVPAFQHLSDAQIAPFADAAETLHLQKDELLLKSEQFLGALYVVQSGELAWTTKTKVSDEQPEQRSELRPVGEGGYMGVCALFSDYAAPSDVIAVKPTTVIKLSAASAEPLIAKDPVAASSLIRYLSSELSQHWVDSLDEAKNAARKPVITFFDAKPYMTKVFRAENEKRGNKFDFDFVKLKLDESSVRLASDSKIVCIFVNDQVSASMASTLQLHGTKMIALRCNGSDNVDLEACTKLKISVARVPNYSPYSVAEHATALMLCLNRKLHRAHSKTVHGDFGLDGLVGFDMHGKTVGVCGTGKIGQCLVDILLGFGCRVLCYDKYQADSLKSRKGVTYTTIDTLLSQSDIISLHLPLLPDTQYFLNDEKLSKCKNGVMIINTSRGPLIDTKALLKHLKTGKVGYAGLDVYEGEKGYFFEDKRQEGIVDDVLARLMSFPNVVITGHQAFLTTDALEKIAETTLDNIEEFLSGKMLTELTNSCNTK